MATNTVLLKHANAALQSEGDANVILTAGELAETDGTEGVDPHGTAAGAAAPTFVGMPIDPSLDIDDDIPAGERVRLHHCPPGVHVNALAGAAVADGEYLVSNGDGALRPLDTAGGDTAGSVIGRAHGSAGGAGERVEIEVV